MGEWYYLAAMANMGMGNNVTALDQIREAVRQEPDNMQYRILLQRMEGGGGWYQQQQEAFWRYAHSRRMICVMPAAGPWPVSCAGRAAFSAADSEKVCHRCPETEMGYHKAAYPYVCKGGSCRIRFANSN